jgi:DNA adenine methylase
MPIPPWLGEKRRLGDKLLPLYPLHEYYLEVFCGGAALYFLQSVSIPAEVLNDINGDLWTPSVLQDMSCCC